MKIPDMPRRQQYTRADYKEAGLWLLASLCHPLAYLRWYRYNQGRIEAVFPGLLIGTTLGILGLIYLDFPMLFRAASALLLLWLFGSFLTLLFLVTRPGELTWRIVSDRAARTMMSAGLLLFALTLNLTLGSLSRIAYRTSFTGIGVALFGLVFLWALIGVYLIFRLPKDAIVGGQASPRQRAPR